MTLTIDLSTLFRVLWWLYWNLLIERRVEATVEVSLGVFRFLFLPSLSLRKNFVPALPFWRSWPVEAEARHE